MRPAVPVALFAAAAAAAALSLGASLAACSTLVGADFNDVVPAGPGNGFPNPDGGFVPPFDGSVGPGLDSGPARDGAVAAGDAASCGPSQKSCNGKCVAVSDPQYGCQSSTCAPCNLAFATASCSGAICAISACAPGHDDCDGRSNNGCEADLASSHDHCGSCTNACGSSQVCSASQCTSACSGGLVDCGGSCVNTSSDPNHCGGCTACPLPTNGQPTCSSGSCGVACPSGSNNCGGNPPACVVESATSCGASCLACSGPSSGMGTPVCASDHTCSFTCFGGYNSCFGDCIQNSPSYCGPTCQLCNSPTFGTATCSASGVCDFTCQSGYTKSGTSCVPVGVDSGGGTNDYGYSTPLTGAAVSSVTGYFYGYQLTISQSGTLEDFGILGPGTSGNVTLALYTDSAGAPGTLIAQTASTSLTPASQLIPPTTSATVTAGTYWLLGEYDSVVSINTNAVTNSSQNDSYFTMASYGPAPGAAGATSAYTGVEFNYYVAIR